jgi:hypothetical protein
VSNNLEIENLMGIYLAIQNLASVNSAIKPKLEQHAFRDANSCWNNKIAFDLVTSGGQNGHLYKLSFIFLVPVFIRHLW